MERGGRPQNLKKWKPGQSGNKNGRPKKIPLLKELLANVLGEQKEGKSAAEVILMRLRAKAIQGDVRAAELLLDRAYGKAKQEVQFNLEDNRKMVADLFPLDEEYQKTLQREAEEKAKELESHTDETNG
jgi:hypothetical protein